MCINSLNRYNKMIDVARNPADTFEILVASDIHLGVEEENPIRGDDSFNTFEEILGIARSQNVDFVLLGGDLFHANKPSMLAIHKCLSTLRKNCMGDKPIAVEFLSEQEEVFGHCNHRVVNYEDANLNISLPVYSIHGNHDDPSGFKCMGSMDILAASGLINYFGKWTDYTHVKLFPILLRKGSTRLAIYGLCHIKDERLARLFLEKRVEFKRPSENPDSWCYILILHQNRVDRGPKSYVQESMIPDFFHLVIWGHEHECRIFPEYNSEKGFHVIQPGSPVATSLCDGESVAKHVAVVKVCSLNVRVEPIVLETVRPFVFKSMKLSDASITGPKKTTKIESYVNEIIESMFEKSKDLLSGNDNQPTLPLLRLRIEYSEEDEYFNPIRFGQRYSDRVANPTDMIQLKKVTAKRAKKGDFIDQEAMDKITDELETPVDRESLGRKVEKVIENYFGSADESKRMNVLSEKGLNEAISRVISKDDKDALTAIIEHQKKKTMEYLKSVETLDETNILEKIKEFRRSRYSKPEEETLELKRFLDDCANASRFGVSSQMNSTRNDSDSDMDMRMDISSGSINPSDSVSQRPARGRGSRGGRSSKGGRGGGRAASSNTNVSVASTRASRGRARTSSQMSISDMFSSQLDVDSPSKKRKVVYASDSDDSF